ncbi:LPP20 family lipoprotein [Helicobacter pylori]|uniref:LPP20 family lipoprotein n=1 Tax=Helicobacter pylori TaxID=210 RepID=UPI000423D058|nr:LPP20 family lipoprotein [Helicobacter pylori]
MKKIILACLVTFLSANLSAEPKWYSKAYNKTNTQKGYLYGSGSATSKEASKQKALADLVASISVVVNSQIHIQKSRVDNKLKSSDSQTINLKTDDLELDNVEIVNQEAQDGIYYTRLRINQNLFLQGLSDKYNALYGQFATLMPKACKGVFLQQSKSMGDLLAKAMPIERILKAYSIPVKSLESYEKMYYQNAFKPKVQIVFNDDSDTEIKDALLGAYARVLTPSNEEKLYQIKNEVFTDSNNGITRIRVIINASDCQGSPILNKNIEVDEKNKNFAITRLQSLLYKELKNYANKEGQGNTGL